MFDCSTEKTQEGDFAYGILHDEGREKYLQPLMKKRGTALQDVLPFTI